MTCAHAAGDVGPDHGEQRDEADAEHDAEEPVGGHEVGGLTGEYEGTLTYDLAAYAGHWRAVHYTQFTLNGLKAGGIRLSTKGVLRVYEVVFAKFFKRFQPKQLQLALQMGDERVVAHMD